MARSRTGRDGQGEPVQQDESSAGSVWSEVGTASETVTVRFGRWNWSSGRLTLTPSAPTAPGRRSVWTLSRRAFLRSLASLAAAAAIAPPIELIASAGTRSAHPEPRPDVDGSKVLSSDLVPAHVADLFDGVRTIPHVVDGIRCSCGCADLPGMYSLLSCYEGTGMAQYCTICQGEARLALRLHGEGRTLAEIRAAIDARFG